MIGYSWSRRYGTIQALEAELELFKFKGEGWYFEKKDVLLVAKDESEMFQVWVWNSPNEDPRKALKRIVDLPNHGV